MIARYRVLWYLLSASLLLACAPTQTPTPTPAPLAPMATAAPAQPKVLTIALKEEPTILISTHISGAYTLGRSVRMAVHQRLATYDDRGDVHPQLAMELPSRAAGTWLVRADGTMQMTYKLRPGVTWHDGTPLTARDFEFGWTVTKDPEIPMGQRSVSTSINSVTVTDDLTFVTEWSRTDPYAHAIAEEGMGPLPVHLLESVYRTDKERFQNLQYWNTEFVGVGPYRLEEWSPASHLVLRGYERFYAGPPRIDRLVFRFIPNATTVVANLLSGAVDGAIPPAIDFNQAVTVQSEWERAGKRPLAVVQPLRFRMIAAQFRDPRPRDVLDVRVRRALLHALDRRALGDALYGEMVPVADASMAPDDVKWSWVQDVVQRYDYNPTRALQFLSEVGWRPDGSGTLLDPEGNRVSLAVWSDPGELEARQLAIVGDQWRRLGLGIEEIVLSAGQARDTRYSSSFPSFQIAQLAIGAETTLLRFHSSNCPTEENRWTGPNAGCYRDPQHDRVVDALRSAIDPDEQRQLYRTMLARESQQLPVLPLYFDVQVTLFREGVVGVRGDTRPRTSATWNVAEWDVR